MFLSTPSPLRSSVRRTSMRASTSRPRPRQAAGGSSSGSGGTWRPRADTSASAAPPAAAMSRSAAGRARANSRNQLPAETKSEVPGKSPIDQRRLRAAGYVDPASDPLLAASFAGMGGSLLERGTAGGGPRGRLILVTSAAAREGKTFAAIGLALTLARAHAGQVLLVDCGRRPAICQALGVAPTPGLSDLLADPDLDLEDVAWRSDPGRLCLLGPGSDPEALPELIASARALETLQTWLDPEHDRLIVVDAPALSHRLARVLAVLAGQLAVVVRAGQTEAPVLAAALDRLRTRAQVEIVLNGAPDSGGSPAGGGR